MPSGAVSIVATFAATYLVGAIGHQAYIIALITLPGILAAGLLLGKPFSIIIIFSSFLSNDPQA